MFAKSDMQHFFALLAIVLAGYLLFPRGSSPSKGSLIPQTDADRIIRIDILRQGDPYAVVLHRRDGTWKLAIDRTHEYPARTEKTTALLRALLQKRTLASVGSIGAENAGIGTVGSYSMRVFIDDGSKNGTKELKHSFRQYRRDREMAVCEEG